MVANDEHYFVPVVNSILKVVGVVPVVAQHIDVDGKLHCTYEPEGPPGRDVDKKVPSEIALVLHAEQCTDRVQLFANLQRALSTKEYASKLREALSRECTLALRLSKPCASVLIDSEAPEGLFADSNNAPEPKLSPTVKGRRQFYQVDFSQPPPYSQCHALDSPRAMQRHTDWPHCDPRAFSPDVKRPKPNAPTQARSTCCKQLFTTGNMFTTVGWQDQGELARNRAHAMLTHSRKHD